MAKYAISAEGAASMRALAKQLYTEANAILESSAALEAKVSAIGEGLGIYESEILGIIQRGRNTLNVNRESVLELAQGILKKADEIDALIALYSDSVSENSHTAVAASKATVAKVPQYTTINDIPQKEYECISSYNSDSARFNNPIRAGKTTKETRLFSRMIGERELTDSKTLYRRATFEDLNGLQIDFNNLNTLSGQQFNFCGFMSTSPDARLPNYVSHGNLVFEFEAPAGTSALDLSSLMYSEVIFDSPLCQINHAERRGNDIYIRASIK